MLRDMLVTVRVRPARRYDRPEIRTSTEGPAPPPQARALLVVPAASVAGLAAVVATVHRFLQRVLGVLLFFGHDRAPSVGCRIDG
jgi:hypothetical protein